MRRFLNFLKLFKKAYHDFAENDPLIMGSSTAFFALFSIPAILFIFLILFGLILDEAVIKENIMGPLERTFGADAADQVLTIITAFSDIDNGVKYIIGGIVFFFIVSTTLFLVVRNNINKMWHVRPKEGYIRKSMIVKRLLSVPIFFLGGILVIVSVLADSVLNFLDGYFPDAFAVVDVNLIFIANRVVSVIIAAFWFTMLFKLIPDAKINWKTAGAGGFMTALLFMMGVFVLGRLFIGNLEQVYGPGNAIILMLLFIFYASSLVYYGASFTKAFGEFINNKLVPEKWAEQYEIKSVKE
jgi:membrane protein